MVYKRSVVAGALVVAALVLRVPLPGLSEQLSRQAQSAWGLSFRTGGATFGLLGGARLGDVEVDVASDGFRLDADVNRVLVRHRWSVRRPVLIERLQLLDPVVEVVVGREEPEASADRDRRAAPEGAEAETGTAAEARDAEPAWFDVDDLSVELTRATLSLVDITSEGFTVRATGLGASLGSFTRSESGETWLQTVSARGGFVADELRLGLVRLRDARGGLELAGGRLKVIDLHFACGDSEMQMPSVEIDLQSEPISLTTREPLLQRARSRPDAEWETMSNLTALGTRCL